MSESLPESTVDKWHKMRDAYDLDPSKPNPYREVDRCACFLSLPISPLPNQLLAVTLDKLRLQLLEEESRELADGCQGHSCPITSTERLYTVQVSTTRRSTKIKDSNDYLDTNV